MSRDTLVTRVDPKAGPPHDLAAVARILAEEGKVVFPTETAYALGAREGTKAARELAATAPGPGGRPGGAAPDRPTLHLFRAEDARRHVARIPPRAARLLKKFWPGPLTVLLPRGEGQEIAIRVVAHPVGRALLEAAAVPVVAVPATAVPGCSSGGGGSGGEVAPLVDGAEAAQALAGRVDAVVDAGRTPLGDDTTLVRIDAEDRWECLREGIISRDALARHLTTTVVFVCTGNSCRSPMAEGIFRRHLATRLGFSEAQLEERGFRVLSAGTAASEGHPAATAAVKTMQERGIDIARHRSRPVTQDLMEEATCVLVMSPSHALTIADWWPEHAAKVHVLDEEGIIDPIGGPIELYRECADHIDRCVREIIETHVPGPLP